MCDSYSRSLSIRLPPVLLLRFSLLSTCSHLLEGALLRCCMLLFYLESLSSLRAKRYARVWFSALRRLYSALNFLSSYMNSARSSSSLLRYSLNCCASRSASLLRCIIVFCLNSSFLSLICSNSGNCAFTLAYLELSNSAMESRSCCTFFSICCGEPLSVNSAFSSSYLLRYILSTSSRLLACRASTC